MATLTKAQQREQARIEYDVFLAVCPSRQLLDRISDKWVVLVLCALAGGSSAHPEPGPLRYSELSRIVAGVSQKMLTQTLRHLERDGLVDRSVTPTVPVTVHYELTDLGRSLEAMTRQVRDWAQRNMDEVQQHRVDHDASVAPRS